MEEDTNPEELDVPTYDYDYVHEWAFLPVSKKLGIQEEATELIRDIGASDPFFGYEPMTDPEDVEHYEEIIQQRIEDLKGERDKEVVDSFVAQFEAWAAEDPYIGLTHLEDEEEKPWSFESQESDLGNTYMELEPEYISINEADYLNLVLEPDDAILVRYALLESAMYLEDQAWDADQREDKVSPELLRRGKHTLQIIADMIEAWLESL